MRAARGIWIASASALIVASLWFLADRSRRTDPVEFDAWRCPPVTVVRTEEKEAVLFELRDRVTSEVLIQLRGSTDLVCDPPRLVVWDVNGDGEEDLYFQHCGGHGFLACDGGSAEYEPLREADRSFQTVWYRAVFGRSGGAIALTLLLAAAGALIAIAFVAARRT